jgi:hypothetical protein
VNSHGVSTPSLNLKERNGATQGTEGRNNKGKEGEDDTQHEVPGPPSAERGDGAAASERNTSDRPSSPRRTEVSVPSFILHTRRGMLMQEMLYRQGAAQGNVIAWRKVPANHGCRWLKTCPLYCVPGKDAAFVGGKVVLPTAQHGSI